MTPLALQFRRALLAVAFVAAEIALLNIIEQRGWLQ
jgi:hypothetical protein